MRECRENQAQVILALRVFLATCAWVKFHKGSAKGQDAEPQLIRNYGFLSGPANVCGTH